SAQHISTPGPITPTYNFVTDQLINVDQAALEAQIAAIANNPTLTDEQRRLAIRDAVTVATGSTGGTCAEQFNDLAFGLDMAGTITAIAGAGAEALGDVAPGGGIPGIILQGI